MKTVSVIVINFNGSSDLAACLDSVAAQDHPACDVVVIDNASTDGSREWLRSKAGEAGWGFRLIENEANVGFSPALNQGIAATHGELVMPLNTDVVLEAGYVSALAAALEDPLTGSATGKLERFPPGGEDNIIDSAGHVIFRNRLAENLGEGRPAAASFLEPMEVWGVCGAAALYSREMLEDVAVDGEVFDEDFFAFWEDLDLDWRARMRGWRSMLVPAASAWHRRGGAGYRKSLLVETHNYKNRYLMMMKNDSARSLLPNLPGLIVTEVLKGAALLLRCPRALLGFVQAARLLPVMLRKRRTIQSRRLVPARELEHWFQPFDYRVWIKRHLFNRGEMIVEAHAERAACGE